MNAQLSRIRGIAEFLFSEANFATWEVLLAIPLVAAKRILLPQRRAQTQAASSLLFNKGEEWKLSQFQKC